MFKAITNKEKKLRAYLFIDSYNHIYMHAWNKWEMFMCLNPNSYEFKSLDYKLSRNVRQELLLTEQ